MTGLNTIIKYREYYVRPMDWIEMNHSVLSMKRCVVFDFVTRKKNILPNQNIQGKSGEVVKILVGGCN